MKPGLKPLFTGIALCVAGLFVVPVAIILPILLSDSGDTPFIAPGSAEFTVEEPARYYLWHDHQTIFEGTSYNRPVEIPDGVTISVSQADGEALAFTSDGSMSMSRGSHSSQSIGYVDVPTTGLWTVEVSGEAEPFVVSFAESKLLKIFGLIFGGVGLCLLLGGAGVILVVIGVVRLAQGKS